MDAATMVASVASVQRPPEVTVQEKPVKREAPQAMPSLVEIKPIFGGDRASEFEAEGRKDGGSQELRDATVIEAIEQANRALQTNNAYLKFSIHEKTHQIMVKVVDSQTDEVIRELPPEKVLDMVARMWELAGILVDEKR
jgi:flagellar protein FlaG